MKKIFLIATAAIILSVSITYADQTKCEDIGYIASKIMSLRQSNKKMQDIIKIIGKDSPFVSVVIKAYETPRYRTDEYKQNAINDFENKYYMECIKHERRKK